MSATAGDVPDFDRRLGPTLERTQRRGAVRAPMTVPVELGLAAGPASGKTVDLSESGLRCILERTTDAGPVPAARDVVGVTLVLPDLTVRCQAQVVRRHPREDAKLELSVRFTGLPERDQDDVRRRVFARLRELRQRGLL
jgi:c-di-GMP-binding flagellar brake protein YcgR